MPLDAGKLGAIGYCFGGAAVLEFASSGADIAGVVTFHGGLGTSMPAKLGTVKASVLVLNGANDQGAADDIAGFQTEMDAAGGGLAVRQFQRRGALFCAAGSERPTRLHLQRADCHRAERMTRVFFAERFASVK